ncbi:MAG TPA: hypothetical protein VMF66_18080 [Candidatus Acidoferrum sp.]|nr:hypothetical protein [Candidatus Acidoferrum sp.]
MGSITKRMDVQKAAEDVRLRTLGKIPRPLDRFIYLASTRDYNTGLYHHEGLASRYSAEVACEALADCHREVYRQLLFCSLKDLVAQMEAYVDSSHTLARDFISVWRGIEPYRVAVPVDADSFSAEFLFSNFRIALAIVEQHLASPRNSPQAA